MARPQILQRLKHGKLLCGSVFRLFVETWNWLVSYVDNLKGDYDVNPKNGFIVVDRSDPDSPVIRFRTDNLPEGGGGSGMCGNFSYNEETCAIKSGYVIKGRTPIYITGTTVSAGGYVYVSVPYTGTSEIVTGASSLPSNTTSTTYIPLYYISDELTVRGDYRGAPVVQMWE